MNIVFSNATTSFCGARLLHSYILSSMVALENQIISGRCTTSTCCCFFSAYYDGIWDVRYIRQCAMRGEVGPDEGRWCKERTGTFQVKVKYCHCDNKDGCNSAPSLQNSCHLWFLPIALLTLLLAPFVSPNLAFFVTWNSVAFSDLHDYHSKICDISCRTCIALVLWQCFMMGLSINV